MTGHAYVRRPDAEAPADAFAHAAAEVSRGLRRWQRAAALGGPGAALIVAAILVSLDLFSGTRTAALSIALVACSFGCSVAAATLILATWPVLRPLKRLSGDEATTHRMREALRTPPAFPLAPDIELRARYWVPASLAVSRARLVGLIALLTAMATNSFGLGASSDGSIRTFGFIFGCAAAVAAIAGALTVPFTDRVMRAWSAAHPAPRADDAR